MRFTNTSFSSESREGHLKKYLLTHSGKKVLNLNGLQKTSKQFCEGTVESQHLAWTQGTLGQDRKSTMVLLHTGELSNHIKKNSFFYSDCHFLIRAFTIQSVSRKTIGIVTSLEPEPKRMA